MKIVLKILIGAFGLLGIAYLLPQALQVTGFVAALISSLLIGISNITIRPLLLLLSLPVTIITFGLFTLVIDTVIVLFVARLVDGFMVSGFWWAMLVALLLGVVKYLANKIID